MSLKTTFCLRLFLLLIFSAFLFISGNIHAQNSLKELHVSSICQTGKKSENQWRIRNPNDKDINVTYSTSGSGEVRSLTAKAMDDTYFYTEVTGNINVFYDDGRNLQTINVTSGGEACVVDCPGNADRYFFNIKVTDAEAVENDNALHIPDLFCKGEVAVLSFDDGSYMDLFKDGSGAHLVAGVTVKSGGCEFNGKQYHFDMMFDQMDKTKDLSDLGLNINEDRLRDLIAALSIRTEGITIRQSGSNLTATLTGKSSLGDFDFNAALIREGDAFNVLFNYMFAQMEGSLSFQASIGVSCPPMTVVDFTLVNAETGEDIMTIEEGDVIDLSKLPTTLLNIRANTNPEYVGSVVFDLNEKKSIQTEIVNPYSLFGNFSGGKYKQWTPDPGKYTVTATPYSKTRGKGEKGTPLTINFEFIDSGDPEDEQQVVSYVLVNADTDSDITSIQDGDKINLSTLPTRNLNIRANTKPEHVGSVVFDLNDTKNFQTENVNPYSLAGNFTGGSYKSWTPEPGMYTITATPYSMPHGKGKPGKSKTIRFEVIDSEETEQQVVSFSLVDASTDAEIVTLKEGDIINIAALPTYNLKIRANTSPETVGSVIFDLKNIKNIKTDNHSPYTIDGEDIGKVLSMVSILDEHTLMATPYTMANGGGKAGKSMKLTFHLVFDISKSDMISNNNGEMQVVNIYPNPVEDQISIYYQGKYDETTSLFLYDQYGKASAVSSNLIDDQSSVLNINIADLQLKSGIYFLKISSKNKEGKVLKLLKK